jgi:hypothetical protein
MTIDGKPVACVGDLVVCPRCSGTHVILGSGKKTTLDGKEMACENDPVSDGSFLMAIQQHHATHDVDSGDGVSAAAAYQAAVAQMARQQVDVKRVAAAAKPKGILVADATPGITPEQAAMLLNVDLDYRLALQSGGNRILTPLEIPDFSELSSGSTKNTEKIDFTITRRKDKADALTLEVLDGETIIYTESNTSALLDGGVWQWDGYDDSGMLDTKVLKSKDLKVRLTASGGDKQQVVELPLRNKPKEVNWADLKIDRNTKTVEVTVRPAFSDGGQSGDPISGYTPKTFEQLKTMAKTGIEKYWSRDGSRPNGIGNGINTAQGTFNVTVKADLVGTPKAKGFALKVQLSKSKSYWFIRPDSSTSAGPLSKIVHAVGDWRGNFSGADLSFERTTAHEFGHRVLGAYGGRDYSWTHKGTSGKYTQKANSGTNYPANGEIDLMKYSEQPFQGYYQHLFGRSIAAEEDIKGLLWLARMKFND